MTYKEAYDAAIAGRTIRRLPWPVGETAYYDRIDHKLRGYISRPNCVGMFWIGVLDEAADDWEIL